ncbi:helix-turn-helix transcriptional regulator [Marinimicrobium alkaliphilum]|uniref:helix-turn-helix transcriptional regulator n=1 Tax=Marinimicrobium alkaliphilum TaxID=2202654 RepID=UPI000DB99C8D|nr:helix-turn-helix transcriptional regulator [Marinimicrobium alkaliphilum]
MRSLEAQWQTTVQSFGVAASGMGSWTDALGNLAQITGSKAAQLIGLGPKSSIPFNCIYGLGNDWIEDFQRIGGANPSINPFVRAGTNIPELTSRSSEEFLFEPERRTSVFINEHANVYDIPYACLTPLVLNREMLIGLAVMRGKSQQNLSPPQRAIFNGLSPIIQSAVKLQLALESQTIETVKATFERLSKRVVICDQWANITSISSAAEDFLSKSPVLKIKSKKIKAFSHADQEKLDATFLDMWYKPRSFFVPTAKTLVLGKYQDSPLIMEVIPIAQEGHSLLFDYQLLIVIKEKVTACDIVKRVCDYYDLTLREAQIAIAVTEGKSPVAIAGILSVSESTVRTHIRNIHMKLDTHSLSGLTSKIYLLK